MSKSLNRLMLTVAGLLVAGGFGFTYTSGRISVGTLLFLGTLTLALSVIAVVFARRMNDPDVSVEQMLYKTDHPVRRI